MSGLDIGCGSTRVPISSAEGLPTAVPSLAIEMARLQAPVGISKRFVVTVILKDEAAAAALEAVVIKGVVMVHRYGAADFLTGDV